MSSVPSVSTSCATTWASLVILRASWRAEVRSSCACSRGASVCRRSASVALGAELTLGLLARLARDALGLLAGGREQLVGFGGRLAECSGAAAAALLGLGLGRPQRRTRSWRCSQLLGLDPGGRPQLLGLGAGGGPDLRRLGLGGCAHLLGVGSRPRPSSAPRPLRGRDRLLGFPSALARSSSASDASVRELAARPARAPRRALRGLVAGAFELAGQLGDGLAGLGGHRLGLGARGRRGSPRPPRRPAATRLSAARSASAMRSRRATRSARAVRRRRFGGGDDARDAPGGRAQRVGIVRRSRSSASSARSRDRRWLQILLFPVRREC